VKYEIAVSLNCECGETAEETLQNIKAAGFKSVMFSETDVTGELEDNIKTALALGLKISNVHLGYSREHNDLYHECEERGIAFVKNTIRKLEIMGKYGIPVAVVHPVTASNPRTPRPDATSLRRMKEVVAAAERHNVKIALENLAVHDNEYLFFMLDNIDSELLGVCYDAGHANNYPPRVDMLKTYGHRLFALHLHDNYGDTESDFDYYKDHHFLPFDGTIDWEKLMRKIAATGYNGAIGMELHRANAVVQKYVHMPSLEFLKKAFKRGEKLHKLFVNYQESQ